MLQRIWSQRREVVGAAAYWSGVARFFELMSVPSGALVLMYHSIAAKGESEFIDPPNCIPVDAFERQMAYLSKHRKVASLTDVLTEVRKGQTPAPETICITFDDGYLDNLTVAAPILERYSFPATLFLATGYVDRCESQWADVLFSILRRRTRDRLDLAIDGLRNVDLASPTEFELCRRTLHRYLLTATYPVRTELLSDVDRQLAPGVTVPRLTMNWDEVRRLRDEFPLFEFGGHTRNHIDLRTHAGSGAIEEIRGCAEDIARELGVQPRHFSFPYGRWCAQTQAHVVAAGWSSAVGEGIDVRVRARSDVFAIPRINAPRGNSEFRFKTSGAYPGLLKLLRLY